LIPSRMPFAMCVSCQRTMPFQCRLMVFAASLIGSRRLWGAQKYHFLRNRSPLRGSLDECRAHVDAHLGDRRRIAAMRRQVFGKGADRG